MSACRRETDVLRAAAEDRWTDALRAHLGECDDCVAAASIAPWMGRFARITDREHPLPDPSIVWLKAKLLQGTVDASRASRPLDIAQFIAYAVVAAGWAALLTWKWDAVRTWLGGFTPNAVVTTAARAGSLSMSFFAIVFVLASFTVMLGLHTILAEE
jgi:hypothetical protein